MSGDAWRGEELFRAVFETSLDGMAIADVETRRIVRVNPTMCRMVGREPGELAGRGIEVLHPEPDLPRLLAEFDALARGAIAVAGDVPLLARDGRLLFADVSAVPLALDGRPCVTGIFRDVTERKLAEERLRRLNRVYAVLNGIDQAIIRTCDLPTLFRESCRIAVEDGGLRMAWIGLIDEAAGTLGVAASAGVDEGYTSGLTLWFGDGERRRGPTGTALHDGVRSVCNDIEHDERMAPWREAAMSRGYRSSASFPLVVSGRVRGSISLYADRPGFFDEGEVGLLDGLALNISRAMEVAEREALRLRSEKDLREAEELYHQLFEMESDAIFLIDNAEGRILQANRAASQIYGYGREELLALRNLDLSAEPEETQRATRGVRTVNDVVTIPLRWHRRKDGSSFPVEITARFFTWKERSVHVAAIRDISVRRAAEAALELAGRELAAKYEELKKVDAVKDGLLRDVTHELKTPVAKQAMHLELLKSSLGAECSARVGRLIEVMEKAVGRQESVIRNLLELARLEAGGRGASIGPVRLDEVISSVLEEYRPALEKAGFEAEASVPPLTVSADPGMLWQVFSNIVNNAVKFRRKDAPAGLRIVAAREGGMTVVRFRDSGIGLSPEERERAFDRFYQASASVEGSGVGLSICRMIVAETGGTIAIESDGPGLGATVVVRLPSA